MTTAQDPIAHAARLLREAAEELRQAHTLSSDRNNWIGEPEAKAAYDEHMAAAQALEDWEAAVGAGGVQPLRSVQEGCKVVPLEPTPEMLAALMSPGEAEVLASSPSETFALMLMDRAGIRERYSAMLGAAPQQEPYSIDADPQGIRARVAEAITGALAFGAQGANSPPPGHWLAPFWETAMEEASRANPMPVSSDTLYLLRRLLSNQHTLTGPEFREELAKIVEAAFAARATAPQPAPAPLSDDADRLSEALQRIADASMSMHATRSDMLEHCQDIARAALAAQGGQ